MLAVLLLVLTTQIPCAWGETSMVCHCKQGQTSACLTLQQSDPTKFKELEKALQAVKHAEQLRSQQVVKAAKAEAQVSSSEPEPPDCKGQEHHIISRPIAKALEEHPTLSGIYKPRDSRFVTQAVDEKAHCGYQDWHRKVDEEVIDWLQTHKSTTRKEFEEFLRSIYRRPDIRARFPHGF